MVGFQNASVFGKAGSQNTEKSDLAESAGANPPCPQCGSRKLYRDGLRYAADGSSIQRWLCRTCGYRFSEKPPQTNHEWSINTPSSLVSRRQICALEAKNLDSAAEIKTVAGGRNQSIDVKGKLLLFEFHMQKEGLAESTIAKFSYSMRRLSKLADIDDPESVKEAVSKMKIDTNTKYFYCSVYESFLKFQNKTWRRPKYDYCQRLPEFLPTEEEIDQLIAGSGKKVATLLRLIKETGMRLGECLSLTWLSVDFQKDIVTLTNAEKHSLPRIFNVSHALTGMLQNLPKQNDKVFGIMKRDSAGTCLRNTRKKVAEKLKNPRIAKIHYHLIRHWFGTMEYHKKPDMDYVRRRLGHKSITNTQIYVNMEQAIFASKSDEFLVKTAKTVDEACKLIEVGFEYVTDVDNVKLFRKRK
jgi:integrase/rubredoxin